MPFRSLREVFDSLQNTDRLCDPYSKRLAGESKSDPFDSPGGHEGAPLQYRRANYVEIIRAGENSDRSVRNPHRRGKQDFTGIH
jgi:hypothetical protein